MRVTLYEFVGTGLIIKAKTGIIWTNQAGGHVCLQPECEGLFVPFGNDTGVDGKLISLETRLYAMFTGGVGGLTLSDEWVARAFEHELEAYAETDWLPFSGIKLDPDLLSESVEAWVHVIYRPTRFPALFDGLGDPPFKAVLTWTNSD